MSVPDLSPAQDRLAALLRYEVIDRPAEQAFDDLTLIAAQICQVPIAWVLLIDEQPRWLKAAFGTTVAAQPSDSAFGAHTVLNSEPVLEVRDPEGDVRFQANPLVRGEAGIRFFAGAALVGPDGRARGALCVMDGQRRQLTPDQHAALRGLSRRAIAQLELRRQAEQLSASEQTASRLLTVAEKSRRALLSVLEDEKHSGQELRESAERFRQLAENINEVFWMTDPEKRTMLYISPAYATIWGRTCESLYVQPEGWLEAIHPEDRARVALAASRQVDGSYDEVYRIDRPDGTQRWVRDRAFPVRNAAGIVYRLVGIAADVTERKRSELRAAAQHAVTAVLAESGPLMATALRILEIVCRQLDWSLGVLWTIDRATKTLRCVETWHPPSSEFSAFDAACRNLTFGVGEGVPGAVWKTKEPWWLSDVTQEPTFVRREQAGALGLRGALAFPIKLRDEVFGVVEFFSQQSRPPDEDLLQMFAALGTQIGQFIERKQLEDQFRQAQKMEAIGTLAGGIAHDFNNVLAAIVGFTELAKMESTGNPEVLQCLRAVSEGCARAADLVRQILAFSRLQEQQRKSIQLWPVVEEALKLLRATIPSTIQFEVSLARGGLTVLADPTQIHQVVMNLATNAAHAMRAQGGRLGVKLENCDVDADVAGRHPGVRPGRYARLSVSDTGHGMDEATLSRIFDPFFTTKGPGEGTGLGLAVVHGIMQSHDGVVAVFSQPGAGTQFHLYFPSEASEMLEAAVDAPATPQGKGERILLIDDELPLVTMLKKVLERLGYRVDAHTAPAAACEVFRADPDAYALVITDMTMPGMTGTDLADQLLNLRPGLPLILTTGYNMTLTRERARAMGFQEMLMKPLTVHSLGAAVHRVLAAANPT